MLLTSSGMDQEIHTNKSKYGVGEPTLSMDMLQERILTIYYIPVISWDMHLLQELLSTVIQNIIFYPQSPSCLV